MANETTKTETIDATENGKKGDNTKTLMAPVKPETKRTVALHAILNDVGQGEFAAKVLDDWAAENPVSVSKG